MTLGTQELVAREPEIKTWMLNRLLCLWVLSKVWVLSNLGVRRCRHFRDFAKLVWSSSLVPHSFSQALLGAKYLF